MPEPQARPPTSDAARAASLAKDLAAGEACLGVIGLGFVGTPVAAAFAGRLPRRAMLVTLDIVRAAIALCLPFVDQIWQVRA